MSSARTSGNSQGRRHGDPFPLVAPRASVDAAAYRVDDFVPSRRLLSDPRLAESLGALNSLEHTAVAGLKRPAALASDRLTSAQVSVTGRVARRLARYPRQDDDLTDESALASLLAGRSWYSDMDVHQRVDYNPDHLKIFRKKLVPRPLAPRLNGDARDLLDRYQTTIERSEQEVEHLLANSDVPVVRPYWDPSLARDADLRLSFFKKLISM